MTYTSLEQRAAQGYLDVFPLFIPEESASVSIEEQKEFYDIMKKLYKLAYDEPQLFVPKLHEDAVPPMLFSRKIGFGTGNADKHEKIPQIRRYPDLADVPGGYRK